MWSEILWWKKQEVSQIFFTYFILIIINIMILFIFLNLLPWDFPASVNAGLLYSAVEAMNVSLAEERRLTSKLQRVQTVNNFCWPLVLKCTGYSELPSSEDVSGSCHYNNPNLQVEQQSFTSVLGWVMPFFSLYVLDLAVFPQNCLCWTTDQKKMEEGMMVPLFSSVSFHKGLASRETP